MNKRDVNAGTEIIYRKIDPVTGKKATEPVYSALVNDGYYATDGEYRVNIAGVYGSVGLEEIEKRWR